MSEVFHYAIYEEVTGRVLRAGRGSSPDIGKIQPLGPGEALYEGEIDPAKEYLPGGAPWPKPDEPVWVTKRQVKEHAARLLSYTDWYALRRADTGEEMPEGVQAYRAAVRAASDALEAMQPIPADYQAAQHWPAKS
jgi:hypothetical protein